MLRILTSMLAAVVAVIFGYQNWENVPVNLIFGPPTRIRLVFLFLIAGGFGYLMAFIRGARRELRVRAQNRSLRRRLRGYEAASAEMKLAARDGSARGTADRPVRRGGRRGSGNGQRKRLLLEDPMDSPEANVPDYDEGDDLQVIQWRGRKATSCNP